MPNYDNNFFDYVNSGAISSAKEIVPIILDELQIKSVLDVGCGQGAWLSVWKDLGVEDVVGIDGDYVDVARLLIPESSFIGCDLVQEFNVERKFDLVQSLEVAEHIPESSAKLFISSLVLHGELILFSAAVKGQGGDHHVNEQNYEYWRKHFERHNFVAIDYIRKKVVGKKTIEPWYRYNVFLFAAENIVENLSSNLRRQVVESDVKLRDISPIHYKIRKTFVRFVPLSVATQVAKIKERIVTFLEKNKKRQRTNSE